MEIVIKSRITSGMLNLSVQYHYSDILIIFVEKPCRRWTRQKNIAKRTGIMRMNDKYNISEIIDLNRELVTHPAATFYGRVTGDSMTDAGIGKGDVLVIDKSLDARDGDLAVCFLDGEFVVRRIQYSDRGLRLLPADTECPAAEISDGSDFSLWGVVTYVIKKVR